MIERMPPSSLPRCLSTRLWRPNCSCTAFGATTISPFHRRRLASHVSRTRSPAAPPTRRPLVPPPTSKAPVLADYDEKAQRRFKIYLIGGLGFGAWIAFYMTYVGTSWRREIKKHAEEMGVLPQNSDVSDRWKQLGRDYDDEVEFSEQCFATNIKGKRQRLVSQAYGKVLEVSAGTGRNFAYYNLQPVDPTNPTARNVISSLTINDQSAIMLGIAEDKLAQEQAQAKQSFPGPVDFVVGDAGLRGVIERPAGGYDTIIETMGLCSMVDPAGFLRTMGKLCRQPGEPSDSIKMQSGSDDGKGGKILLLEHGRSSWEVVNKMLDSGASMHADHYGCWWNKDIARIIQESGLEVETVKRYHLGTTWEIHLRPRRHE